MPARRLWIFLAALVGASGLIAAALRVAHLERNELQFEGPAFSIVERQGQPGATRISVRLAEVELEPGERAVFEVCARHDLADPDWRDALSFLVWLPERGRKEIQAPLDAAHQARVRSNSEEGCLTLGSGLVEQSGLYAVDVVFPDGDPAPAVRSAPLRARVLARKPLTRREGLWVLAIALAGMVAIFAAFTPPRASSRPTGRIRWAALGMATALALGAAVLFAPLGGSFGGFSRGLALAVVEVGVACAFALPLGGLRGPLALHAPVRAPWASLAAAVVLAGLLNPAARLAMRVVPSTGEAPIETFISWPSGALAFAALGMVVPLAEELLFRGFLFGALEPRGRLLASVVTVICFTAAHVQQAFGNWGALLAVTVTGIVLTALRAVTGSTLVPAVCHLLYNFSLWIGSFPG